jgi:hypothetical protein
VIRPNGVDMNDSMPTLSLDSIQQIAQVSDGKAKHLKETCIWALAHCNHSNGVRLRVVHGEYSAFHFVRWQEEGIDHQALLRSYNRDDATQFGAEALALLISINRTEYDAIERAITTTGVDYWLGFKNRNPNEPFHRAGRLEISGIMTETPTNTVKARLRAKLPQTRPTDHTFPVYIIVVEFSQPYATMVLKDDDSE